MFAASQPERVHSLVWWEPWPRSTWAPDFPWGVDEEHVRRSAKLTADLWGSNGYGAALIAFEDFGTGFPVDFVADMGRALEAESNARRGGRAPTDLERDRHPGDIAPSVAAPTLLLTGFDDDIADYVASLMSDAEVRVLPVSWGEDPAENIAAMLRNVRQWLGVAPPARDLNRMLAAVLFTDIVGSTEPAHQAWRRGVAFGSSVVT